MQRRKDHLPFRDTQTPQEREDRAKQKVKDVAFQKADAPVAVRDYQDAQDAEREKTARLKAERLARLDP